MVNELKIRKTIQENGNQLYDRLGTTSKNLQYLAGELMAGNEEYIRRIQSENQPLTIGADSILNRGFTENQICFLTALEKELKWYKSERKK